MLLTKCVVIVAACNDVLTTGFTRTKARQPDSPGVRNITTGHSVTTADSSDYPPSRFEDIKRSEISTAFVDPRGTSKPAAFVSGAYPISATMRSVDLGPQGVRGKRGFFDFRSGPAASRGVKMSISSPILEANGAGNPLNKIATISLEDAVRSEKERRTNDLNRDSALIAKRPAPQPPRMSAEDAMSRSVSLRRKEVASVSSQPSMPPSSSLEPMPVAMTSSAQLSPGIEELRRRSPRQRPADSPMSTTSSSSPLSSNSSPTIPLPALQQSLPKQLGQELIDEESLLKEMDMMGTMDREGRMNFTVQPSQSTSGFIIQPTAYAPTEAGQEKGLPAPSMGVDANVRRQEIRPSRQLPKTPTEGAAPVPVSTLQKRPVIGLPSNPRATAMKVLAKEASAGRQQTVMFVNNIVYDNPETVRDIINDANTKGQARFSTQSIVDRPRPIPRHLESDRAIFPADASLSLAGHRRSKSVGAIIGRKSALMRNPGSPTQLPPLPPPPPKDFFSKMDRPKPNNTKSMTFDEKMTLLFPTPPTGEVASRRRSSVPEIPTRPLDFMPIVVSPSEGYYGDSRMSQSTSRTWRTSVKTGNTLQANELPLQSRDYSEGREPSVSNLMVMSDAAPRLSPGASTIGRKRASSPLLPSIRYSSTTTTTTSSDHTQDDTMTNWGSVHFSVVAVPIPANRLMARTTYITGGERGERGEARSDANMVAPAAASMGSSRSPLPLLPATTYSAAGNGRALSPPMSKEDDVQIRNIADDNSAEDKSEEKRESQWHRRVGDNNALSFSDRKERTRSRKMPPPTPLLLNPSSTKNPVIVKAAEPSPLESPEQALAYIQEQLKRYEEPTSAATEDESPTRRLALLDNLEREMDMQAGQWQKMQHTMRHTSMSTIQTLSPAAESRRQSMLSTYITAAAVPQFQQQRHQQQKDSAAITVGTDRLAVHNSYIQNGNYRTSTSGDSLLSPVDASAALLRSSIFNKKSPLSNAAFSLSALGSPTPPDSDGDDFEFRLNRPDDAADAAFVESLAIKLSQPALEQPESKQCLWTQTAKPATMTTTTLLWAPAPAVPSRESPIFIALSQLPVHALGKKSKATKAPLSGPLPIESVNLWNKSASQSMRATTAQSGRSLWTAHVQVKSAQAQAAPAKEEKKLQVQKKQDREPEKKATVEASQEERRASAGAPLVPRPLTQRPPRRSKRITMLPDILESPKPLPDKRGTLGIFQFPWGERSDTAKLPLYPTRGAPFGAMPGTMASGGGQLGAALEIRSPEFEADEYSSSFFDDYDDDENYYNDYDDEYQGFEDDASDSDDGFDENTLWEIASLLKTEQVPSTLSMFPPALPSGDYMSETTLNDEALDNGDYVDVEEILVNRDYSSPAEIQRESQLWDERQIKSAAAEKSAQAFSMAQPDEATWKSYDTVNRSATLRSKPRASEPAPVETSQLWNRSQTSGKAIKTLPANPRSSLWAAAAAAAEQQTNNKLWMPRTKKMAMPKISKTFLFDKNAAAAAKMESAITRTTDLEPAARHMQRTRVPIRASLEKLTSMHLWGAAQKKQENMLWAPRPKTTTSSKVNKSGLFDKEAAMAAMSAVTRTSDLEPAARHMQRTPRVFARAPLDKLTSTHLWGPTQKTKKIFMWAPRPKLTASSNVIKAGLFDKEAAMMAIIESAVTRTTDLEPAARYMQRTRRVQRAPLDKLTSTHLWGAAQKKMENMLWAPRPKTTMTSKVNKAGLFDKEAALMTIIESAITRTTDLEPAARHMQRTRRVHRAPLETLMSTRLWGAAHQTKSNKMWAPRRKAISKSSANKAMLFDKEVAEATKLAFAVVRSTDMEPAALHMQRTRRVHRAPLETLMSTRLWGAVQQTKSNKMWAPRPKLTASSKVSKAGLFDKKVAEATKLAFAVVRSTDLEPAALYMQRTRRVHRAPLETLSSKQLWAAVQQKKANQMWAPRRKAISKSSANKAMLFDKELAEAAKLALAVVRTTDLEPAALHMQRTRVPIRASLAKLTSTRLWGATEQKKASSMMWTPRTKKAMSSKASKAQLFDKEAAAAAKMASAITRTTDLEPAALYMARMPRIRSRVSLEKLTSSCLWGAKEQTKKASKMWAPRVKKTMSSMASKAQLFDKEAAVAARMETAVTRTTDMEPAARNMPRTHRMPSRAPLEKLMSSSLWAPARPQESKLWVSMPAPEVRAKSHLFDRDVAAVEKMRKPTRFTAKEPVALTTVRAPRKLSHRPVPRLESSNLWPATAAAEHHKQAKTQYNWILATDRESLPLIADDTINASNVGVKQNTWWEKMKAAGASTSRVAPVDPIKLAEAEIDNIRMALQTTPLLPTVQRPLLRRPAGSSSEWDSALQEAVAASYPWLQRRISATPDEWQAELNRAMARSYPFDAACQHPVLAASSSSTAVPISNDVSTTRPVFFQSAEVEETETTSPTETAIQLVQSSPVVEEQMSEADATYHAHIMAMENQALARLQALEGVGHAVVLRY